LGSAYAALGRLHMREANRAEALETEQKAIATAEQLLAAQSSEPKYRKLLGDAYVHLGMAILGEDATPSPDREGLDRALDVFQKALSIHEALAAAYPAERHYLWAVGADYEYMGYAYRKIGELTGASENYRLAVENHQKELEINQALAASEPGNASYRQLVGAAHMDVGNSQMKLGDTGRALDHFRQWRSICESLAAADPTNAEAAAESANSSLTLGRCLAQAGDTAEALQESEKARTINRKLIAANPKNTPLYSTLSMTDEQIAGILETVGETTAAIDSYQDAIAALENWSAVKSANGEGRNRIARDYDAIGKLYEKRARAESTSAAQRQQAWADARASFKRSLEVREKMQLEGLANRGDAGLAEASRAIARCDTALAGGTGVTGDRR
jgi:tetratricopeptide (TPR) repeat protein